MIDAFSLKDKVVVVTGAYGLIGKEVCDALACFGASLVVIDIVPEEKLVDLSNELINLFNYLPYRNIVLVNEIASNFLTVPKSLLFVIEQIVRTTITSSLTLEISLKEEENYLGIEYSPNDKITTQFKPENLKEIERVFSIYSIYEIQIEETSAMRKILLPKLTIEKA